MDKKEVKTNIFDIFKGNDGKWSIRAVMAFLAGTTFGVCGIFDSTTEGVSVDSSFYWASVTLVLGLISVRALEHVANIKNGKKLEQDTTN